MPNASKIKIAFTGGHLTPALAVLDEMQAKGIKSFVWFGNIHSQTSSKKYSAEYLLVQQNKNIKYYNIKAGKIWRKWTKPTFFKALFNLILIPIGFVQSLFILFKEKPNLIISFGGYIALAVVISGKLLGIRSVTHEQTIKSGLANKIIAGFASRIFISWKESFKYFPKNKTVYTGNPIRKEVLNVQTDKFNFPNELPIIYITGGNQGSNTINWRLFKILDKVLDKANIIHQVGDSSLSLDLKAAAIAKNSLPDKLKERYIFFANCFDKEIGEIFSKADLIFSRSGANTITEILALGKRAILIPLPWSSNNEQMLNAKMLQEIGLAMIIKQYDQMPPKEILDAINEALGIISLKQDFAGNDYKATKERARSMINPNAARDFVNQII